MKNKFKLDIQFFAEGDDPQNPPVEPNQEPEPSPDEPTDAISYAEALKKVRDSSVPKEVYDKLNAYHQNLLKMTMDNRQLHQEDPEEPVSIEDLRKDLLSERLTNYDFAEKALKLRSETIKQGRPDPFVSPTSDRYEEDAREAKRVADLLQDTLDYCKDNHELFSAVLTSRLRDDPQFLFSQAQKKAKKG